VNSSVLIDSEPMIISAIDSTGLIYTVVRAASAYPFLAMLPNQPANTHAIGAGVFAMVYSTPWATRRRLVQMRLHVRSRIAVTTWRVMPLPAYRQ